MRPIPKKLREQIAADPFMQKCVYQHCWFKPEWEHALLYQNKQINEAWAIIPVCTYHHRGGGMDKDYHRFVALSRATDDDLKKYPRVDWGQMKKYLTKQYAHLA